MKLIFELGTRQTVFLIIFLLPDDVFAVVWNLLIPYTIHSTNTLSVLVISHNDLEQEKKSGQPALCRQRYGLARHFICPKEAFPADKHE